MGYLHEGHLSLVDQARQQSDCVVMSVFVNPLQFGPREDLSSYPRDLERDRRLAEQRGTDILFVPAVDEMYPSAVPLIRITAPDLTNRLCGLHRPGHFEGVLTVVCKLFNIVQPDIAVFGQKDFQQAVLIRQMVRDLDLPVAIEVAPIQREPDGLAMSSRNVYLSPGEREAALALSRALRAAAAAFEAGERNSAALLAAAHAQVEPVTAVRLQYLELVEPDRLQSSEVALTGHVVLLAAHVGNTRLIDNIVLGQ